MKIRIPFTDIEFNCPIQFVDRFQEAKDITEKANRDYDNAKTRVENVRLETKTKLEEYGAVKIQVYDQSLRRFVDIFQKIKNVDFSPIKSNNKLVNQVLNVIKMKPVDFKAIDGIKAAIASGGAGAVSGAAIYGGVGLLASASTGTAISALSGAAATNATLAWLGGGSIASGGLGVAGGTVVLGGLVAIPALLVGGFILNSKSKEALNKAYENKALVDEFISETETAISALLIIKDRCYQMSFIVKKIDTIFQNQITQLEEMIRKYHKKQLLTKPVKFLKNLVIKFYDYFSFKKPIWLVREPKVNYKKFELVDKQRLMVIVGFAQTLKNILDTEIISKEGLATETSQNVLNEGKLLLEGYSENN